MSSIPMIRIGRGFDGFTLAFGLMGPWQRRTDRLLWRRSYGSCFPFFETLFSLAWRGALLFGSLFLIDWISPGLVSCVFRETIGYEMALFALSDCTVFNVPYLPLISLAALFVMALILIYPIRTFRMRIFEIVFMCLNIVFVGYPLKFVAYLASADPTLAGKLLDKSYVFGPLSVAMTSILPPEYKRDSDHLWDVYHRSQSPAHEQELENVLEKFEARYFG